MKNIKIHPLVSAICFLAVGVVTAWTAYVLAKPTIELLNHGVRTKAEVVELANVHQTEFDGYSPVVAFVDNLGNKQRIQCRIASGKPQWRIGEKLDVIYPADRPEDVQTTGLWDSWGLAMIPFVASVLFLMISIVLLLKWAWKLAAK